MISRPVLHAARVAAVAAVLAAQAVHPIQVADPHSRRATDTAEASPLPPQTFYRNGVDGRDGMNASLDQANWFLLVAGTSFDLAPCAVGAAAICIDSGYFKLFVPSVAAPSWTYSGFGFEQFAVTADALRKFPAASHAVRSEQGASTYRFYLGQDYRLVGWEVDVVNPDGTREAFYFGPRR